MYRIVCESYENYVKDFANTKKDFRYKVMLPFGLIIDLEKYKDEKEKETLRYKKLEDFIFLINESIEDYSSFKSLIWTLESRGIKGKYYGVLSKEEFEEQTKIIGMFFKLSYWN